MTIQDRKSAFYFIRDIPYKIQLTVDEQDYCCSTKAEMLARLLKPLNLETRFMICKFNWYDTPIPKDILALTENDIVTHQYLQVFTPETNSWVNCDPTWDIGLKNAGFEIEEWDGIHDTGVAVKSLHTYSPEESADLIKGYADKEKLKDELETHHQLYKALNKWMNIQREV